MSFADVADAVLSWLAGHLHSPPPADPASRHSRWLCAGCHHGRPLHPQVLLCGADTPAVAPVVPVCMVGGQLPGWLILHMSHTCTCLHVD